MPQARWTADPEYTGSMRFSKRHRDMMGEDYARWATADTPQWQLWAAYSAAALVCYLIIRAVHRLLRRIQSDRAARALLLAESRATDASGGARVATKQQRAPTGPVERVCRFCDVAVPQDDMMAAHVGGKRHRRMVALAGSTAGDADACWVWREAAPPPAEAPAPEPAPEIEIPTQTRGKGRWEQPKRRGARGPDRAEVEKYISR